MIIPPTTAVSPAGQLPPGRLEAHEKMQVRAAAHRAKQLYPGPVGDLVARELLDWEQFGYRFTGPSTALLRHVLTAPMPDPESVGQEPRRQPQCELVAGL